MTAIAATPALHAVRRAPDRWRFWGRMLVLPYLLIFLVFVLYPVGYGLWPARHPASYGKLFEDPVFFRPGLDTLVFVLVAINLKMVGAVVPSGFFLQNARWSKVLSPIFHL